MSKVEIDYSNTIIYKITCNDPNVNDVYVGHTTNFVQRKHAHKQSCINEKSPNNKCKLYEVIRANGGWLNWNMEIIHFCNCKNQYEARIKEQEYFVLLNANLNSVEPMPPKKTILVKSSLSHSVNTPGVHLITQCAVDTNKIELTSDISTNNTNKNIKKYRCEKCHYTSTRQSQYDRHLITTKHLKPNITLTNLVEKFPTISSFDCVCGKIYKHQSSLCNHTRICTEKMKFNDAIQLTPNNNNIIIEILKQNNTILLKNQEFKELFLEQNNDFKSMILKKSLPTENNDLIIIELLKQNQDFKHLMIEQNKYMMDQSKQILDIAKNAGTLPR